MSSINFRDTGILGAVVTVFVLIVAVVIAKAQDFVHFNDLAFAAVFVTIPLIVSSVIMVFFLKRQIQVWSLFSEDLKGAISALDRRFDIVAVTAKAEWLVANEQLMRIERSVKCDTVWILTANLEEEIDDTLFAPIIIRNLKKGIKYRYFVPDDPILRGRAYGLKKAVGNHEGLSFDFIDDSLFRIISMQDVAIYISDRNCKAYMNLPIKEGGTAYFIELGSAQTETLVGHLRAYLEKTDVAASRI
jgi:hypothetical protein